MYLKKLELIGFKSFFNKTTLHFEPGITAVVGPNGCGKSNVFDSIRWVLGEQSIKVLRGSQMQDVIFNGTDSKEPLSMAEVTLTFDNNNRFFNVDHQEMAITRRIFRSGESEYLLNKSLVRLKDILDLLMGTGIGAESYSLVAQGKIDLILSSRPEDRRLVFDEAAGITKYKTQKKEAARKLEETEQNLLRVGDIIIEVKRQIGSLERQANKARRYKEIFEELRSKEVALAIWQKREFLKQKDELIKQLTELQAQEVKLMEAVREQESKMGSRQTELKALQDNIMAVKNEILNLDNLVIRDKEHISFNQQKITELSDTQVYLNRQIEQVKGKLVMDEGKLSNMKDEYNGIQKDIDTKTRVLRENEQKLNALGLCIKTSLENMAKAKREILELVAKIANTKNEITDSTAKQQMHLARKRRLELEKAKVNEEKSAVEDNLENLTQELKNLNKTIDDLNQKINCLKDESEQTGLSLSKINSDIEHLEKQTLALSSHKEFIERLKTKYEDIGESLNAVIYLDKLPDEKVSGLVVKIKDCEPSSLNVLNASAINTEQGQSVKLSGEAKLFDLDTQKINQKLMDYQKELDSLRSVKQAKEDRIEELNKLIQDLELNRRQEDIALANKKTFHQTILEQFDKIKEEEEIIALELSDIEKEMLILEERLNGLGTLEAQLDKEHKQTEKNIVDEQNKVSTDSSLKEKVLVEIAEVKTELGALAKRIHSDEVTLKILEDTYRLDKDTLLNLERQLQDTEDKSKAMALEIRDFQSEINQTQQLAENNKFALKKLEDDYQRISDSTQETTQRIQTEKKEIDNLKNRLYQLQTQNKDIDFKFLSVKERILQNYKIDLETVEDALQEYDKNASLEEIQKLKEKLNSLGNVNLVAIEEYDELKKRYDFLIQQQNDLVSAKESLHEAILKINRTTRKMFLETFEQIALEFRNYFRLLFNGGDAQIFLVDGQDVLESGIEIICRPPGKKLQNVLLLSGGEKSLSAIALIFAIFKVKPSPFCVLDEIDAALDEANVERFSRILQEFAKQSQFIVITHNKRTIVNADVMYGITMEDSGISKIVSVKFAKDTEKEKILVAEAV